MGNGTWTLQPQRVLVGKVDGFLANPDNFEEGEAKPSSTVVSHLKAALESLANQPINPEGVRITAFYGDISASWESNDRLLQLISTENGVRLFQAALHEDQLPDGGSQLMADPTKFDFQPAFEWLRS